MYRIKVTPNYYAGTLNAPKEHFLTYHELPEEHNDWNPNNYEIVECETEQEAQDIIDAVDPDGIYYLSHGEAGRPEYEIVDTDEGSGWGDDCVDSSGAYGDDWDEVDGDDLPDGVKDTLDGLSIDYRNDGDDTEIWTAETEIDGVEYAIAYCAKSIAVQTYSDDLGCLNWDKATYYRKTAE